MIVGDNSTGVATNVKLLKTSLDMNFSSIGEDDNYYKEYGKSLGFSTRRRSSYATARGSLITRVVFVCCREEVHKIKPSQDDQNDGKLKRKRNTSTVRTDCKAMLCIALDIEIQTWYVNKFIEDHNHGMVSPEKRHLMRANKVMPPAVKSLEEIFNKQKLQVSK
ncbi:hypothetical protein MKX03_031109, partial [Papaver bracteatum]